MRPYFAKMADLGKSLSPAKREASQDNVQQIKEIEKEYERIADKVKNAGLPTSKVNERGQLTVWQRLEYLVEPGTWTPLHTIFDPKSNEEGTTNVVDGLGKINGRWAVIAGFDNKVMAGAWLPGQADKVLRVTDVAKHLRIPLVWLVNCSGVKLTMQEEVYPDRRGGGATFFRNAELQQLGIPVFAAIYGTNPAGGGYHSISPSILLAHKGCNIAVGGGGIVSGMSPKGYFDEEGAETIIEATRKFKETPPGGVKIHYDETGFFREVYDTEEAVLDGVKEYMGMIPAYDPRFFRVAPPAEPKFPADDLNHLISLNAKQIYSFEDVLARLTDNSEHTEYRKDYGPEIYTGLAKVDGFPVAIIGNKQGLLGQGYPEYATYPGIGGKLYRQGLIKMSEFVTLCGRDRLPIIWFQDTSGIDVGDIAEKAEMLGLGQALIYSIEQTNIPMALFVLRKGTAAAHYVMGGPTANNHCVFTLGTPATEISVMHGETAAAASFARRLVKDKDSGKSLAPTIEKMNALAQQYKDQSGPIYCAKRGFIDEMTPFTKIRDYMVAFTGSVYQNPGSICPPHQMITPRCCKG